MMSKVWLVAVEDEDGIRDGGAGWQVFVDGVSVIEHIGADDLDLANSEFDPLWKALGVTVEFDYE